MLTVSKPQSKLSHVTQAIFLILDSSDFEECKAEVKSMYQSIKPELTESAQDQLILDIFLLSGSYDTFSEFWQYMNR
jgi:hypothetical protein